MKNKRWMSLLLLLCLLFTACQRFPQKEESEASEETSSEESTESKETSSDSSKESQEPVKVPETPLRGGTLKLSMVLQKEYNPLLTEDPYVAQVLSLIYSPLIDFDEKGYPHPAIVSQWEMASDNKKVILTVNDKARWQDGSYVTPGDIVYSVAVIQNTENSVYKPCVEYVEGINILDDRRVEIYFTESSPLNLNRLYFPVISQDYYTYDDHALEPMGSGPYQLDSYVTMQKFILTANPLYYGQRPYITKAEIELSRSEVRMDSFNQGVTNLVYTDRISWSSYINKSTVGVHMFPSSELQMITMNLENLPSADTRKAIAYALDAREILRTTNVDKGDLTEIPISPARWYGPENPSHFGHSSEKVSELLDLSEQLTVRVLVNRNNEMQLDIAEEIASELKDQGITANLMLLAAEDYEQALVQQDFDLALETVSVDSDLDLKHLLMSMWDNHSGYTSETMNRLLHEAGLQTEEQTIHQSFVQIGNQLAEDLPFYPLFFVKKATLTGLGVRGQLSPTEHYVFRGVENLYMESM